MNYEIKKCLCCNKDNLSCVLDLNKQPLANSYSPAGTELEEYPLAVNLCNNCYHMQLSFRVDPDLMFRNYLYVSGTTKTLRDYFDWFANKIKSEYPESTNVLDIACNDGSQLNSFKKIGYNTFGIDPANNLLELSTESGHKVLCDYFNSNSVEKLKTFYKLPYVDVITAQNVFAHNDNPYDFLLSCKSIMHQNSKLYIQTSQATMVENNQFDTIYHEHISFFNTNSMKAVVERAGLFLNNVELANIHGNSYIFEIGRRQLNNNTVQNRLDHESKLGLFEKDTYLNYSNFCKTIASDLKTKLQELVEDGYTIAGYGAAAKGVVLINFSKINLDFVVDDNPLKHNLCMPGTNIPIHSPSFLSNYSNNKLILLPLAWNFFDEIKSKVNNILGDNKALFLKYFPKVEIC
jgi:2-polyprenyl-3-methyl-5-hydroxy-6-metoxy-1,4-benzoquinol methylase